MSDLSQIDQITDRVERLLVRYEELTRTNALLYTQIDSLTQERNSLKSGCTPRSTTMTNCSLLA